MLSRSRVNVAKTRTTPLANHFKLSKEKSPKTGEERDHMVLVPYASVVGSLMYDMVYDTLKLTSQIRSKAVVSSK